MKKYAKLLDKETGLVSVSLAADPDMPYFTEHGYAYLDVEQAYNGNWYLTGYAPVKPAPTHEEVRKTRSQAYANEVDPLMAEYNRKKLFELFTKNEETELLEKIESAVKAIKESNPYPVEE